MFRKMRLTPWQYQIAVFISFSALYLAIRAVSLSYWTPTVGLCFASVLLLPRRFWPALLAGNMAALAPVAHACFAYYGWTGALLHLIPASAFAIVLIWPLRAYLPCAVSGRRMVEAITAQHIVVLLGCTAAFGLLSATNSTLQYFLTLPAGVDVRASLMLWAPAYLLGAYLGCLTIVPLALAVHQAVRHADSWHGLVRRMGRSRLLWEGVVLCLACVGLLTAIGAGMAGDMWRQVARMAMFLPVAWMAVRYGWQGAAVGGTAASVGTMLTMPVQYDASTILAQSIMVSQSIIAFSITVLLPLGAKISSLNEQERRLTMDHRQMRLAAKREIYQGELRLRRDAKLLDDAHEGVAEGYSRLLDRIQDVLPENEHKPFRIQLMLARRLMQSVQDSIHPAQWQQGGLHAALWNGPINNTLEECGVAFDSHVSERVAMLTADAQWMLYRLACEAVAYTLVESPATPLIRLYVRVMMVGPQRTIPWTVLVVAGERQPRGAKPVWIALPDRNHLLLSRLGALGLDLGDMSERAGLYEGRLRANHRRQRIAVSLLDVSETQSNDWSCAA